MNPAEHPTCANCGGGSWGPSSVVEKTDTDGGGWEPASEDEAKAAWANGWRPKNMCANCPELGTPCKDCWVRAGYPEEKYAEAHGKKAPTEPAPASAETPADVVPGVGSGLGPDLTTRLDKDLAAAEADLRDTSPGGDPDPNAPPANHDGDEPSSADVTVQSDPIDKTKADTRKDFPPLVDDDQKAAAEATTPKTGPGRGGSKPKKGG